MSRGLITYVAIIATTAAALAVGIVLLDPPTLHGVDELAGVVVLTGLSAIAEGIGVRFAAGRAVFSVSLIPTVTMVPLFGPSVAVVSTAAAQVFARSVLQKQPLVKRIFNVAQLTLAIGLGAVVYSSMDGPVLGVGGQFQLGGMLLPMAGLIVTYFVVNMSLVSAVIALDTGKRVIDIWRQFAPVGFANDLASSSFAVFVVFAYSELGIGGLFVVLLPLFFLQHSYGLQDRLAKQSREVLEFTIRTIEAKDPHTSGHSLRVASLCRELAQRLGLPHHKVEEVGTAALLHDIGKIDFAYRDLISSPAQLSDVEREIIRSHPERGARLLASLSSMSKGVLAAVRHHHEHYDGNGYPAGIAGDDIPLAARIIMVVDTVDAMLSNRPYRAALSVNEVRAELQRFSGKQFDPDIVSTFLESGMLERAAHRAEMDRTPLPLSGASLLERAST